MENMEKGSPYEVLRGVVLSLREEDPTSFQDFDKIPRVVVIGYGGIEAERGRLEIGVIQID